MADMKSIIAEIQQPLWDNWFIKEEIGSGASGTVYKIEAKRDNRTDVSALKVEPITLDDVMYSDKQHRKNYLEKKRLAAINETNIMYKLRKCPYIVGYEDEDIRQLKNTDGFVLLIRMEYLECLHTQVKQGKFNRSESNVLKLAHDIGSGIQAAHNNNVIHRDIKPSNFFYSLEDKTYKLGDFNISKSSASARSFAGTEGYIAPEIYKAKQSIDNVYTKQADIYSFGICLYQLMNNFCFPFEENRLADEAIEIRMNGTPLPMPKAASPEFGRIILKACAYDPINRYASIDEMIADIRRLRGDDTPVITNPFSQHTADNSAFTDDSSEHQQPKKKKSKVLIITAVLLTVIVAVAATIAIILLNKKNKDEDEHIDDPVESVARLYFESEYDYNGFDTLIELTIPNDAIEEYKSTDKYKREKIQHEHYIEVDEEEGIEETVTHVEKTRKLTQDELIHAKGYFYYVFIDRNVYEKIEISEGYEVKVKYDIIHNEDVNTFTERICVVMVDGEGWKVVQAPADDLQYFTLPME